MRQERRIVLFGKTGAGKSSAGNTILGEKLFTSRSTARSETGHVVPKKKTINGRITKVVDTPGLFITESPNILKSAKDYLIELCSPGPNVLIIILRLGQYGEQEIEVVKEIVSLFGEQIFRYSMILFTHGDDLGEGQTIEDFVEESKELKKLVEKCGGRCHVLDNKYWNQEHEYRSNSVQVKKLLNSIDDLIEENGGDYYTIEMLNRQNLKKTFRQVTNTVWPLLKNRKMWYHVVFVLGGCFCTFKCFKFIRARQTPYINLCHLLNDRLRHLIVDVIY